MLLFLSEISITNAFIPLIILLGISALIAVVLSVFKLSLVPNFVLEILIGMILGVWYNDFSIQHGFESVNNIVYTLGLVFLLFLSGLDIDYKVFKNSHDAPTKDVSVVKLSILLIAGIYLLSFIFSWAFGGFYGEHFLGKKFDAIIILTICLASTFASIVVPILHQGKVAHTTIGKVISTYSIISELLCIVLLSAYMIINPVTGNSSPILLLAIFLILVIIFLFFNYVPPRLFRKTAVGLTNLGFRLIVVVILLLTFLSEHTGGELILGSFLAGMVLKGARLNRRIEERLIGIGNGIFIPMFFIILGTKIPFFTIIQNPSELLMTLILTVALLVVKIPFLYLLKWYKTKVVLPSMLIVTCTIIASVAAEHLGVFSSSLSQALISASVLTCLIPPILFEAIFPFKNCQSDFELKKDGLVE